MAAKINGYALAGLGAGLLLFWSGFTGKSVLASLQSLIQGRQPTGGAVNAPTIIPDASGTASGDFTVSAGGVYSSSSLAELWVANGGPQSTASFAAQVAMAESSGNASATSANPDGGTNVGLWQLDTRGVGAGHTVAQLQDPDTNARITISATGGGRNWSSWSDPVVNALPGRRYGGG